MTETAKRWRTLIVDDEPLAREGIRARLMSLGGFDVVGECSSGRSAVAAIRAQAPDLVFLDVQMPIIDGFGVIGEIGADAMPAIVFVTAHDHYAIQAFDARAIDYVLKPIDDARFARAVEGVRARLTESRAATAARQLADLLGDLRRPRARAEPNAGDDRLIVRDGDVIEMVPFDEIDWIAADGDYVRLYVGSRQILMRATMSGLEESLPPSRHVRIHRSAIVNVARVRTLKPLPNTEYDVVLSNGVTLRASRTYTDKLRRAVKLV